MEWQLCNTIPRHLVPSHSHLLFRQRRIPVSPTDRQIPRPGQSWSLLHSSRSIIVGAVPTWDKKQFCWGWDLMGSKDHWPSRTCFNFFLHPPLAWWSAFLTVKFCMSMFPCNCHCLSKSYQIWSGIIYTNAGKEWLLCSVEVIMPFLSVVRMIIHYWRLLQITREY